MRLLPYLYSAFADYHFKGIPPIRAMILEDGSMEGNAQVIEGKLDSEKNPYAMGRIIEKVDQFMFGSAIMVAPFYERQASKRSVRLPAGNWYDFYSGEFVGNNKTITVTAAELKNRIPLFVKEGAVIPMLSKAVKNSKEACGHQLEVRHYGSKAGVFRLYEDDGKTFDYEKGRYRIRQLRVDAHGKLSVKIITDNAPALFGEVKGVKEMSR
jgi:alpha-D-xyloside xylohydrolase